jgi:AcrR family transcriptional regulator
MARPSKNTDQLLLKAGRELIAEKGLSGLSLRAVAKRAGVNLGMFAYHFKGKDDFMRQVAQNLYEDFFKDFSMDTGSETNPLLRLRAALRNLGVFTAHNQTMLLALGRDLAGRHGDSVAFVRKNFPRHVLILFKTLKQCRREGYLEDLPFLTIVSVLAPAVAVPNFLGHFLEETLNNKLPIRIPGIHIAGSVFTSDEAVNTRVDLALKAVATDKGLALLKKERSRA